AFGALLWVSSNKPATPTHATPAAGTASPAATPEAGHGTTAQHPSEPASASSTASANPQKPEPPKPAAPPPDTTDSVLGKVVDASGAAKAGIQVTLAGNAGAKAGATTTDGSGNFLFGKLAPGTYWVSASDPDFLYTTGTTEKVTLEKGRKAEVTLHVKR